MRSGSVATLLLLFALGACGFGQAGVHRAETLTTPFPGTVLSAHVRHGGCSQEGCPFVYRVSITNPTDRDANVQTCTLAEPLSIQLPVMGIAGLDVPARATRTVDARFVLPVQPSDASNLIGRVSCTGLDWHGDPPI
jgi:hypothetical protein